MHYGTQVLVFLFCFLLGVLFYRPGGKRDRPARVALESSLIPRSPSPKTSLARGKKTNKQKGKARDEVYGIEDAYYQPAVLFCNSAVIAIRKLER